MGDIYSIKGIVVDSLTKDPIPNVIVSYKNNVVFSDSKGEFLIKGEQFEDVPLSLNFRIADYIELNKNPKNGDGTIKGDLGVIEVTPNIVGIEGEKIDSSQLDNNLVKDISKPTGLSSISQQKSISKNINKIKFTLIPFILTLISRMGVSNPLQTLKKNETPSTVCPSNEEELKDIISKRNKLVKQLNSLYKVIDTIIKSVGLLDGVILTFQTLFNTLKLIPIPSTPPGIPSLVPPIQDAKPGILKNIEKFSKINSGTLISLKVLQSNLKQALDLLALLDNQIGQCSEDANFLEIQNELKEINQTEAKTYTPPIVNGFNFTTEIEITTKPLKRRRAVAKNQQGIILLRGEYSYSSSDQILIDELIFYIKNNNLKAD